MSTHWSPSNAAAAKEKFWRTAPVDPTRPFQKAGVPYFRRGHDRALMPDNFMPVGEHAGKHLRAVPVDYLIWVDSQPWSRHWAPWAAVHDFIERFITDPEAAAAHNVPTGPVIFVDVLRKHVTTNPLFIPGSAHLHCLPGNEDLLHAFAIGALHLKTAWYQRGRLPHYDLTVAKHAAALRHGAHLITDPQLIEHKDNWLAYFQSKRTPAHE